MARTISNQAESERYVLASSASHLLHRAEQLASERFAELAKDALTLRQFAVLAAIASDPGLSQSALVRITGIDRSTLADMMGRMEKRGLVTRTASALDARALCIHLSQNGAAMLRGMDQHARAADAAILDLLPKTKRRTFVATLEKLSRLADEQALRAEREAKRQAKRQSKQNARAGGAKPRKQSSKHRA
jgi:DNA-binding MarR family transcriptional regulator